MTIDEVITMLNSEDCNLATDRCLMKYKVRDCWKCILEEYTKTVYNKAIDDFVNQFNVIVDEKCGTDTNNYFRKIVKEIAEQLKAGEDNVQKK